MAKNSGIAGAFSGGDLIFVGRVEGRLPALDSPNGTRLYRQLCMACHGETGAGGQNNGASLATAARDVQALANTAWNGKNTMPMFRGTLTEEQMRDIARYVADELFSAHAQ